MSLSTLASFGANEAHIGYLYPAGAQRGTTVYITAGGQYLKGASEVYISGEGVSGKVVQYYQSTERLKKEQREHIQNRIRQAQEKLWAKYPEQKRPPKFQTKTKKRLAAAKLKRENAQKQKNEPKAKAPAEDPDKPKTAPAKQAKPIKMLDHPLLYELENKNLRQLEHISLSLFTSRAKVQPNRQIAEKVLIAITIVPDAKPGVREFRIAAPAGLTNPMVFHIGLLPEKGELEPNNQRAYPPFSKTGALPTPKPYELPVLFNGQIMPGDVDRFRFRAEEGQQLVIETHARSLIPYLADAVPGWFQATVALYDSRGNEVAYADDYSFNPDPVVFYKIDRSGEYELEIHDSIYRGREDFIYRIAIGEQPFITQMFPLGGKEGADTIASIDGWNLPKGEMKLDMQSGDKSIRKAVYYDGKQVSNSMPYAVDTLSEVNESGYNDGIRDGQSINVPVIVNGRIEKSGDIDVFRFSGREGDKIVAEVFSRRLNSPLDSLLKLTDSAGKVVALNDDYVIKDSHLHKDIVGLVTHHADSYLTAKLPSDGNYYVHLADSQSHGSAAHAYRLRISTPQPDFALRVTPSSLSTNAGGITAMRIHVLRKDGFDGAIELQLKDAPAGFEIAGGRIPAGCDAINITLDAPVIQPDAPVILTLQGSAEVGGKTITHTTIPAENMMQAFLYRHLVPSEELMVNVQKKKWSAPRVKLLGNNPVPVPAGGSVEVKLKAIGKRSIPKGLILTLQQAPDGISLEKTTAAGRELTFVLKADKDAMEKGFKGNLIVEAFKEYTPKPRKGVSSTQKKRSSMGILPAIPIQIVAK